MLEVDMSALEMLAKYYDDEELGVWEGDFIRNEKRRGIKLPQLLQNFLGKYGHFDINMGNNQLWLPDKIDPDRAKVDGELQEILLVGSFHNNLVAVLAEDFDKEDPVVYFDDLPEENGEGVTLVFHKSELSLSEFLKIFVLESPVIYNNSLICDEQNEVRESIKEYRSSKLEDLIKRAPRPGRLMCWDEDKKEFLAVILAPEREVLVKFAPGFSPRELESLFNREFFENSQNCNYEHALKIIVKLINFLEKQTSGSFLAEKYAQAGRCCWALKKWRQAEEYYDKAKQMFNYEIQSILEKGQKFYDGLGSFCLAKEDIFKSQAAYREADRICDFLGTGSVRQRGNRFLQQAAVMLESEKPEKAIEYYDQALELFQKEPKECKYEIARCQQLRGEAKKKAQQSSKKQK